MKYLVINYKKITYWEESLTKIWKICMNPNSHPSSFQHLPIDTEKYNIDNL